MGDNKTALITRLGLQAHPEGGYFRRTFQADHRPPLELPEGSRFTLTSIYYLLTDDSPIGHWHRNRSDIVHFFHLGSPISYFLIHPDGQLQTEILGPDVMLGQRCQLAVKGGVWKASCLAAGEYGLISEAVAPGFEPADMQMGEAGVLRKQFPAHSELIDAYSLD